MLKLNEVESYVINNNDSREKSRKMYLKEGDNGLYFEKTFNNNVKRFTSLDDAKYFINNILTFGYNLRITKLQEEFNGEVLVKKHFTNVKDDKTKFNLTLDELTSDDIEELMFPEGRMIFKPKDLNFLISRRDYIKKMINIKINQLIDFHNMLNITFSFVAKDNDTDVCDGTCLICKEIKKQVELLDSPYLNKSLKKFNTAQKRFANADGKMNSWSSEDLQILFFDFNKLVAENPELTIPEIADTFYQTSRSPFYALIRQARSFGNIDYLFSEMDKRKRGRKSNNK